MIEFVNCGYRTAKSFGHMSRIRRQSAEGADQLNRIDSLTERVPSTSRREVTSAAMRNENLVVTEFGRWLLTKFVNFADRAVQSFEHSSRVRRSQCRRCGVAEPNRYADRAVPSTSRRELTFRDAQRNTGVAARDYHAPVV